MSTATLSEVSETPLHLALFSCDRTNSVACKALKLHVTFPNTYASQLETRILERPSFTSDNTEAVKGISTLVHWESHGDVGGELGDQIVEARVLVPCQFKIRIYCAGRISWDN